jgi:hypothetical protein
VRRLTGSKGNLSFETRAGVITARFQGDEVTVNLTPPKDLRLRQQVKLSIGPTEIHSLDTGVPHAVLFVPDADKAMVLPLGAEIRHHPHFAPRGTNVNFVQVLGPGQIRVRTYERGVEGETLACGTGVTASALITAELRGFPSPIQVQVQSGDTLEISFDRANGQFHQRRPGWPGRVCVRGKDRSVMERAASPYAILRNWDFLFYLIGRFVASFGQQMLTWQSAGSFTNGPIPRCCSAWSG